MCDAGPISVHDIFLIKSCYKPLGSIRSKNLIKLNVLVKKMGAVSFAFEGQASKRNTAELDHRFALETPSNRI